MASTTLQDSPLLKLPAELRNNIYRLTIVTPGFYDLWSLQYFAEPAFLATCKQIRHETLGLFYAENVFQIYLHYAKNGTLRDMPCLAISKNQLLRQVQLDVLASGLTDYLSMFSKCFPLASHVRYTPDGSYKKLVRRALDNLQGWGFCLTGARFTGQKTKWDVRKRYVEVLEAQLEEICKKAGLKLVGSA